eukprot:TRINITY_DN599_c0_g1_i6.p2 TRINITY_DN599_c0_g1~~TRINITY_DN599_c0_g1_i6.p2  ORF type:complete len:167 (-),score=62.03 TRINITY_DN599_c0_g1_i6:158-658(-)
MGTAWHHVDGKLINISVGEDGTVWGCNRQHDIYLRIGCTAASPLGTSWHKADGKLKQVHTGPHFQVWGVNAQDDIYIRTGTCATNRLGTAWHHVDGKLKWVAIGKHFAVGVNAKDEIYRRNGVDHEKCPFGMGWEKMPGSLKQVHVNHEGHLWGVNLHDDIYGIAP